LAKGLNIWILSTLTFISLTHTIDAAIAFFSGNNALLPKTYPLVGSYFAQMPVTLYLCASAGSTIIMWCLTCLVAFNNPIEALLKSTLTDSQQQGEAEQQLVEAHTDFFDLMYQSMEENRQELGKHNDLILNLRAEVKDMQKMRETFRETTDELAGLKKQVTILEEKMIFPLVCRACGKPLRTDFSLCPYCGAEINIKQEAVICEPNFFQ
jgi:rubrerythrin